MTVATEAVASRWTCQECGVAVSWADGHRGPLPDGWSDSADGLFCLKCRRERVAEAAAPPEEGNREERAKLRRASLIEFEVRRTPDRPNNQIAKACRSSVVAVAAARERIESETAKA